MIVLSPGARPATGGIEGFRRKSYGRYDNGMGQFALTNCEPLGADSGVAPGRWFETVLYGKSQFLLQQPSCRMILTLGSFFQGAFVNLADGQERQLRFEHKQFWYLVVRNPGAAPCV